MRAGGGHTKARAAFPQGCREAAGHGTQRWPLADDRGQGMAEQCLEGNSVPPPRVVCES